MEIGRRLGLIGIAALLSIGVSGCGKHYWGKPGTTAEDFDRDSNECTRRTAETGGQAIREKFEEIYRSCLTAKGYVRAQRVEPGPGWHRGIE